MSAALNSSRWDRADASAHYPIHFHMARKVPYETTIASNSINELMTRWIVLHSTLGVRVANNIGYKSIGHGFYLEDATETGKVFDAYLGISAPAAIDNRSEIQESPAYFRIIKISRTPAPLTLRKSRISVSLDF